MWRHRLDKSATARKPSLFSCSFLLSLSITAAPTCSTASPAGGDVDSGRRVYDFYCYQCHGYSGDARTLASTFLDPPPRNFTQSDPDSLTQERMVDAITNGRPGTAMVSFTSVASAEEISAVVGYIRDNFMHGDRPQLIYHTRENGWPDHDRYAAAFPFADGTIPLDTPWDQLNAEQLAGKKLFMQACISCHDRAIVNNEGPIWELRALSYPRRHYSHRMDMDSLSSASPYLKHERPPDTSGLTPEQQRGAALFQQNCAFCHGADGTGKNWIGSFLEPHARDLTQAAIVNQATERLRQVVRNGLEGTSMPAWKHVLDDGQIDDVVSYLKRNHNNPIQ